MSPISSRKSVPPSASSNLPRRSRDRAGERALHVAEQLALDQLLGDRRAVHLDERPAAAAAQRVNRAGHQLLAGAVLAVDQHSAVGRRRHRDLLAQLLHRVALADHCQPSIHVRSQRPVLGFEPALAHRVADHQSTVFSSESGFSTKSNAPILMARTADSMLPCPEIITTGASTWRSRSFSSVARPSMPGSQMSRTMTS